MREDNFYKFCISACIFMILISLSMNVVTALDIFGTGASPILDPGTGSQTTIGGFDITSLFGENISSWFTPAALIGLLGLGLVLAFATKTGNVTVVGAYFFGIIFWGSWFANTAMFTSYGGEYPVMAAIWLMITVIMIFIFAGAVIGIFGGSD